MIGRRRGSYRFCFIVLLAVPGIIIHLLNVINRQRPVETNPVHPTVKQPIASFCSSRSTKRGNGQKVLAISLFGPTENPGTFTLNKSLVFLQELIQDMKEVYPDHWILRVYYDEKILSQEIVSSFEQRSNSIDFCNVQKLNVSSIPPKIWRFLPAVDKTVSIMASRDLDSPLTKRERAAIDEWLASKLTFHFMRDHPQHLVSMKEILRCIIDHSLKAPILGGMWAFRVEYDRFFSKIFHSKIFDTNLITKYSLNRDQQFLADHLWSYAHNRAMVHASYWCHSPYWNRHHRPFPTQRPADNSTTYCFIGCLRPCCDNGHFGNIPCPIECRPKEHRDWLYC